MNNIYMYLLHDKLLSDKVKARKLKYNVVKYTMIGQELYKRSHFLPCLQYAKKEKIEFILHEIFKEVYDNRITGGYLAHKVI